MSVEGRGSPAEVPGEAVQDLAHLEWLDLKGAQDLGERRRVRLVAVKHDLEGTAVK